MDELVPIFTGLFLVEPVIDKSISKFAISKHHITYHYSPGDPKMPSGIEEHDWSYIDHQGIYDDGEILASHVNILNPKVINSDGIEKANPNSGTVSWKCQRARYDDKKNLIGEESIPLHITWSSGDLPPVASGIRLKKCLSSNEGLDKNYRSIDSIYRKYDNNNGVSLNFKSLMENNNLNPKEYVDLDEYFKRIKLLRSTLNPIGIWRTFKAQPKDLGV